MIQQLRSLSPGKLVRCLVKSDDYVKRGDTYAEIEVMIKMYMILIATDDVIVQFIKQQNSTLESGNIIGVLTLDDPNDSYDYQTPSYDSLTELINTQFAVFVVLLNFFYHHDSWINSATTDSPTGSVQYLGYFTFCEITDFNEDQTICHIEPAMTYQLELTRLSNFDITPYHTDNRQLEPKQVVEAVKVFINQHDKKLWRLRVIEAEVHFKVEDPTLVTGYPLCVIINNVSGYIVKVETYQKSIRILWNCASHHSLNLECPSDVLEAKELVLDENNNIHKVEKASETNLDGRKIIVIANDIIYHIRSFSPIEDQFFYKATELARSLRIPRVYLAVKSDGFECLKSSGLIAGITSRAYEDIFTITLVTCRSVTTKVEPRNLYASHVIHPIVTPDDGTDEGYVI
ncbi:2427_t:CDS:10 [Funneliformis geosporum]|uniref:2427_t:CDS:1 n=1 Tax=Funneliformis geosporum TaxID=1117311 RepID=A0A9W4SWA4_9GLOM|nr:2427_t:CDS:10 [Funneliformis geosporum]